MKKIYQRSSRRHCSRRRRQRLQGHGANHPGWPGRCPCWAL